MPLSPYIGRLRASIGHDLLLLPSVAVLPRDDRGRLLLVRHADSGLWGTIGGAVEVGESPAEAAVREAAEEAGVELALGPIVAAVGGPGYAFTYPNGDEVAYVATVYDARVVGGTPVPDGDEVTEVAWVAPAELTALALDRVAVSLVADLGLDRT